MFADPVQDFEGQKTTELISTVLLAVSGVRIQNLAFPQVTNKGTRSC